MNQNSVNGSESFWSSNAEAPASGHHVASTGSCIYIVHCSTQSLLFIIYNRVECRSINGCSCTEYFASLDAQQMVYIRSSGEDLKLYPTSL